MNNSLFADNHSFLNNHRNSFRRIEKDCRLRFLRWRWNFLSYNLHLFSFLWTFNSLKYKTQSMRLMAKLETYVEVGMQVEIWGQLILWSFAGEMYQLCLHECCKMYDSLNSTLVSMPIETSHSSSADVSNISTPKSRNRDIDSFMRISTFMDFPIHIVSSAGNIASNK